GQPREIKSKKTAERSEEERVVGEVSEIRQTVVVDSSPPQKKAKKQKKVVPNDQLAADAQVSQAPKQSTPETPGSQIPKRSTAEAAAAEVIKPKKKKH